jgi:hypothetical protein
MVEVEEIQRAVEVMSSYDGLQQEKRSVPGGGSNLN